MAGAPKITRRKSIIILTSIFAVTIIFLWFKFQGEQAAELHMIDFTYYNNTGYYPPCVSITGTVLNSSPTTANNVTLIVEIYIENVSPHGAQLLKTEFVDLGSISGNSSINVNVDISYHIDSKYWVFNRAILDVSWTN